MKLTTKSRYGTRMILDLALHSNGSPVPLSDTSKRQSISLKYLEKLIRKLREAGIVNSWRGSHGGHMLARSPHEITIGDIVRALEKNPAVKNCAEHNEKNCTMCNRPGECLSQWIWIEASKAMLERLDQITIAMLLKNRKNLIHNNRI